MGILKISKQCYSKKARFWMLACLVYSHFGQFLKLYILLYNNEGKMFFIIFLTKKI